MIPQTNNKTIDTAITIGVVVIIVLILSKIGKVISNPLGTLSGTPEEQGGTSQNVQVNTSKLSFPASSYKIWCDEIENYVWGSGLFPDLTSGSSWGGDIPLSNQVEIAKIMVNLKTMDDWNKMISEYGKRGRGIVISDQPNLIQTLQKYITNKSVKNNINKALQLRGIAITI